MKIGISLHLSLDISIIRSLHQSSIVWGVICSVVRIAQGVPCTIIVMQSAKTTLLAFGALESSAIRSLIIMPHKVGPETDPCG